MTLAQRRVWAGRVQQVWAQEPVQVSARAWSARVRPQVLGEARQWVAGAGRQSASGEARQSVWLAVGLQVLPAMARQV
jgi:hypothetical protein